MRSFQSSLEHCDERASRSTCSSRSSPLAGCASPMRPGRLASDPHDDGRQPRDGRDFSVAVLAASFDEVIRSGMGIASWWNKLRGRQASAPAADRVDGFDRETPATWVATEKVNDRLTIHEYHHATMTLNGAIAARTFLTEGLSAWGGMEVRITVPADGSAAVVGLAREMLVIQEQFAAEGRPATLGGFTSFKTSKLPGIELAGIMYARGGSVSGIPKAEAMLVAVLLHSEELALVQEGLATRVLGLLARRARVFPYPSCWEIRTTPVFRPTDQAKSLIAKTPCAALGDVRATVIGESLDDALPVARVRLSLPANAPETLATIWGDTSMRLLTLLVQLAPDADGQATWMPGATQRQANTVGTTMPRRLGCAFVMLTGSDEIPAQLRYIEDGAGLILTNAMLDRVRDALITGEKLRLQVDDRTELVVEFRSEILVDPFTNAKLRARGGWEQYEPTLPRPADEPATKAVEVNQVVLLLPDEEMESRVTAPALASFIRAVQDTVERVACLHPVESPVPVAVKVTLLPSEAPRVQLAFQGERAPALLEPLAQELTALTPIAVRDEVPFWIDTIVRPQSLSS